MSLRGFRIDEDLGFKNSIYVLIVIFRQVVNFNNFNIP